MIVIDRIGEHILTILCRWTCYTMLCRQTTSQATYVGTVMIETLQSQENDIQRTKECNQSHVEDNTIYHPLSTIRYSKLCIHPFYHYRGLYKLGSQILKGFSSMEERMPYKQEVGGSIPPCPNDIIMSVKNN